MASKQMKLTSLADAKRYLGISADTTTEDRLIDSLLLYASRMVQKAVGCDILQATYSKEVHSGDGGDMLYLDNWPLIRVNRCAVDCDEIVAVKYAGDATHASIQVTDDSVRLRKAEAGVWSDLVFMMSDNVTVDDMATTIAAETGWTTTVTSTYTNYPSTEFVKQPAITAKDTTADLRVPEATEDEYEIENEAWSVLYNPYTWSRERRNIFIDYVGGWERQDIPEPIRSATQELTAILYNLAKKDATLKSETIGDYKYQLSGAAIGNIFQTSGQSGAATAMVEVKVAPYRRAMVYGSRG